MSFNLLQGTSGGVLTNQRSSGGDVKPTVVLSPTAGNIRFSKALASLMRLVDGDRVVVGTGIQNLGGAINVPYPVVSNPEGSPSRFSAAQDELTFIVFKGHTNSEDILNAEYEVATPYTGEFKDKEARSAWEAARTEWVVAEIAKRGLPADKPFGNLLRNAGTSKVFSSRNAWETMGGTQETSVAYSAYGDPIYGIKVVNDVASLVTATTTDEEGAQYVFINSEATEENAVWTMGTFAECKAANPFFMLSFVAVKPKGAARGATGASKVDEIGDDFITDEGDEDEGFEEV